MLKDVDLRYLKMLKTKYVQNVQNMWWYADLICTIYRPEKTAKKVTKNWNADSS